MNNSDKKFPLQENVPLMQKIIVFLPIAILTMSLIAMNNSVTNLLNPRLKEINLPGIYAIMTTLLTLTSTIAGPIGGKLSDVLGRKKTALIGVGIYALGMFVLGSIPNVAVLIVAYSMMGLAFGTINPLSSAMVADVMDKRDVPAYIGFSQGLMSFGAIIIPYFSGWISGIFAAGTAIKSLLIFATLSWVAILLLYPDKKNIEGSEEIKYKSFDWIGLAMMFFFVAPLSIGLTLGGKSIPWMSVWSLLLYACSIISLFLFIRRMKTKENALIDIRLFDVKGYVAIILITTLTMPTVTLIGSYLIRYSQNVLGFTAAQTGAWSVRRFVPVILSPLIGLWLSKSIKKVQSYRLALVGGGFVSIASVAMLFFCLAEGTPGWMILLALCLFQGGTAFENAPSKALVASALPIDLRGSGLALNSYVNSVLSTIYAAIAAMFYNAMDFTNAVVWMIIVALFCLIVREIIAITKLKDLNV